MIQYLEPIIRQALQQLPGAELIVGPEEGYQGQPRGLWAKRYGDPKNRPINDPNFNNINLEKVIWIQLQWPIDKYRGLILRISNTQIQYYDYIVDTQHRRINNGRGIHLDIAWENPDLIATLTTLLSKENTQACRAS